MDLHLIFENEYFNKTTGHLNIRNLNENYITKFVNKNFYNKVNMLPLVILKWSLLNVDYNGDYCSK